MQADSLPSEPPGKPIKLIANGNLLNGIRSSNMVLCDNLDSGIGWEVGGGFKREEMYIYAYLQLNHVDIWQKLTQYCKPIILQLKIK